MKAVAALRHQFGGHAVKSRPARPARRASTAGPTSGTGATPTQGWRAPAPSRGHRLPVLGGRPSSTSSPGSPCWSGPNGVGQDEPGRGARLPGHAGSHRVAADAPLIRRGAERAVVRGHGGPPRPGAAASSWRSPPGRANRARINRAPVAAAARRARASCAPCCSRRRTWRWSAATRPSAAGSSTSCWSSRHPRLAGVRADYDRVLKQRSALLKTARAGARRSAGPAHPRRLGRPPRPARRRAAGRPPGAGRRARAARPGGVRRGRAVVGRRSRWLPDAASRPATSAELPADVGDAGGRCCCAALARVRRQEVERGVCLVGPHRDDLELRLGDGPAKGYASHGESWAFALALRLASYRLLLRRRRRAGAVLDDVFAELDARRRARAGRRRRAGRAGAGHRRGRRGRAGRARRRPVRR